MRLVPTELEGVMIVEPKVLGDARGYFVETFETERFAAVGLPASFVLDGLSRSVRGTIRGLHLQHPTGQGKLVSALVGSILDVALDVRVGSPTFGRWTSALLDDQDHRQLWIPVGFAHGFCVLSEHALVAYKCTAPYRREAELGVAWNDPDLAIPWPAPDPLLSDKDLRHSPLRSIDRERLPRYPS